MNAKNHDLYHIDVVNWTILQKKKTRISLVNILLVNIKTGQIAYSL